jgi:aconitate hydratase
LQFIGGITRKTLKLDGSEVFDITGLEARLAPRSHLTCTITRTSGEQESMALLLRLDTKPEIEYYRHGGILKYVLRGRIAQGDVA